MFSTKKLHGLYGSNLRHAVGCNFLSFKVETVGQGVVVVLVEDEESHSNGTSIGIYAVIQRNEIQLIPTEIRISICKLTGGRPV